MKERKESRNQWMVLRESAAWDRPCIAGLAGLVGFIDDALRRCKTNESHFLVG